MKILVTGGTGFVGRYLTKVLEQKGHQVVNFSRSEGGSLLDKEALKKAVRGIDVVYHVAASIDEKDPDIFRVNVDGTRNLLEACEAERVGRFIHVSTVGVMGNVEGRADENTPMKPVTNYEKSKAEAEKLVLEHQEVMPVTIVRPPFVYGPNDVWVKIIRLVKKRYPIIGKGDNSFQMVYVKDLADALAFILEKEECEGETYLVAGDEKKTFRQVYAEIAKNLGMDVEEKDVKSVPLWLGKIAARFFALKAMVFGGKPIVNPDHVSRLARNRDYDTRKIRALGWKPKWSLEQGMKETVEELKKQGKI